MKNFCRGLAFCFCPVGRLYETGLSAAEAGSVPSFPASNESADSWCRHGRHYFIWQRTSISITSSSPAWRVPTWFRWRESGRKTESASGGDGLLANPRSRPTPLSDADIGIGRVAFAAFRHRKAEKEKRVSFLYFWGQKYQKPPHVVFRGSVRSAALHGARKIKPMRHPVTDAPQPAPSFSASNESADSWCRRWRHFFYMAMHPGILFSRKAIPDLVPMAKERTEG